MLGSVAPTSDLAELPNEALMSLGPLLANAQRLLQANFQPARVYIGPFGHTPGYPIHFHLIPIYAWVERLFWSDQRYRVLEDFGESSQDISTDGAELTFFVWREFCESVEPPPIEGPSLAQVVTILRSEVQRSNPVSFEQ